MYIHFLTSNPAYALDRQVSAVSGASRAADLEAALGETTSSSEGLLPVYSDAEVPVAESDI